MKNFKQNYNFKQVQKTVQCSCGSYAIERTKKNYPFGKKSKCRKVIFFVCPKCGKRQ